MQLHLFSLVPRNINTSHLFLNLCTGYPLEQESISKYCSWFIKHYMALHLSTSQICSSLTPQQEHFGQQAVAIYSSLAPDPKKGRQLLVYMPHKNGTPCLTQLAIFKNRLKTSFINSILLNCVCACVHVSMCGCVSGCACMSLSVYDVIHMLVYLHLHSSIDS